MAESDETPKTTVWVFNGEGANLPSAVFSSKERAESWIERHRLSGVLTEYPVDEAVYDHIVRSGKWVPKRDDQRSPEFIGTFNSAYLRHDHYVRGAVPNSAHG